jgi:hypothetical protein
MLVECEECHAVVDAVVVGAYEHYELGSDVTGKYSFLKCPKCKSPFIVVQVEDGADWDQPSRVYPPIEAISTAIPFPITATYLEARACFKARAYTATVVMCRKVLEGICEEHKVVARNLAIALREMRDRGIIESRLFEWADALRISGNEAAHSVNTSIAVQDARDILEFTNALLE